MSRWPYSWACTAFGPIN